MGDGERYPTVWMSHFSIFSLLAKIKKIAYIIDDMHVLYVINKTRVRKSLSLTQVIKPIQTQSPSSSQFVRVHRGEGDLLSDIGGSRGSGASRIFRGQGSKL